jgi:hypothetical protein
MDKRWITIGVSGVELTPEVQKYLDDLNEKFNKSGLFKRQCRDMLVFGKSEITDEMIAKEIAEMSDKKFGAFDYCTGLPLE